jgi:hypothetical protein
MKLIKPDFKITKEHCQWFSVGGREITAIYHPSALLRDPRRRPEAFDDLKEIQRKLKSYKISEKNIFMPEFRPVELKDREWCTTDVQVKY